MFERRSLWACLFCSQLALVVVASGLATTGCLPLVAFHSPADKLGHLVAYGSLSFFAVAFFGPARRWRVVLVLLGVATLEELSQRFLPARTFDLGDLAANAVGICLFGALAARRPRP